MKSYIVIFFCFFYVGLFSQKKDTLYFLIDEKDTLITKLTNSSNGKHSGYRLTDEKRIKKLNRTPLVEGKVWVPESDDDFYTFGPSFSFDRSKDTIVTKSYLKALEIIRDRKAFLRIDKVLFHYTLFFIEPKDCGETYILRKVYPVVLE